MRCLPERLFLLLVAFGLAICRAEEATPHPLVWDAMDKTIEPKAGDGAALFVFNVTNRSDRPVLVTQVRPSCGCTVVDVPASPWVLGPGAQGVLKATVDFRGKDGEVAKALYVAAEGEATQTLLMHVKVPPMDETDRKRNQATAAANRQAVFRNECALCHAVPAAGKRGAALFHAVCASCHLSPQRASMVPDLLVARDPRDAAWWKKWISEGREGSLMPGFGEKAGGPLSGAQIDSLVEYLLANFPTEPRKN